MSKMHNLIIKHKEEGFLAYITHWDHFWVNRATGRVIDVAFTYKVITGDEGGKGYVQSVGSFERTFEIVGSMSTDKGVH